MEQSSGSQTGRHGPVGATSWHHCHPARIPCVSSTPSLRSTHSCVRLVRVFGLGFDVRKPGTAAGALDASFETHARIEIFSLPTDVAESGAAAPALEPIVSLAVPARVHRLAWTGRGACPSLCVSRPCAGPPSNPAIDAVCRGGRARGHHGSAGRRPGERCRRSLRRARPLDGYCLVLGVSVPTRRLPR